MAIRNTGVRYDLIARDSASRTFATVGRNASSLERGLGKLAKAAGVAGLALAGGIAVGLAESAKKAVEFQAQMTKIQTQAGASAKDVAVLSKSVLELGKTTQQGPQQLSEALYHLKSVGMDNVDAMKALKTASDLAAVGGSNLEATTNALAGAWRTGIKGATSMDEAAKTLNATIGAGNMTMDDMVAALGTGILPTAKTFGLTLSQVGSALALFTDEGVDSASAATRLRMSISLLGAPSGAASKQLAKIGLTGTQLGNAMRSKDGIIGAISLLKDHLDKSGLSATQSAALLSHAFGGGKSSSAILSMVNNLDVLKKKQLQVNDSMGKFGAAVAAQKKTVAAQFALIKSNIEVASIQLGSKLLPVLSTFVVFVNKTAIPAVGTFAHSLMRMVPVDSIKRDFTSLTRGVSDFIDGFSPKSPKRKTITLPSPTIKAAATTIPGYLQRVPTLTVPSPTIKPSTTKIPGYLLAPKPVKSQAQKAGEQLRGLISGGIGDAIKGIDWKTVGSSLGEILGKGIDWLTIHTADIAKKLEKAMGSIDWVNVGKAVGGQALGFGIGFITSMGRELFSASFWAKHWWDVIIASLSFVGVGKLAGPIAKIFEHIPILKMFSPMLRGVEKMAGPLGSAMSKVVKFFGSSLWKGIGRIFPEATAVLERETGLFGTRLGVWALDLKAAGGRAIRGLGNGIKSTFAYPIEKLGEGIGLMLRPFVRAGSWLIRRGGELVSGLGRGIGSAASAIGRFATEHVVNPVKNAFSSAGSWLVGRGSAAVSGLRSGISAGASRIGGWVTDHVISPVRGAFSTAGSWLSSVGGNLLSGLRNGIVTAMKDMGTWLKSNLVDPVVNAVKHFFGIHSPSKVFAGIGGHLVSGLLKGLATSNGLDIAKTVFGDLPSALAGLVSKGLVHIEQLPGKALNALKGLGSKGMKILGQDLTGGGASATSGSNQAIGKQMMLAAGWGPDQWPMLKTLWNNESGWRSNALNPSSGAYGIPQALPAAKMESAGPDWMTNPATQIAWGLGYIQQRYGSPGMALAQWNSRSPHWYAAGGLAPIGQTAWVGEKGPELMQVTSNGTRIYNNRDSMSLAGMLGMQVPGYAAGTVAAGQVASATRRVQQAQAQVDHYRKLEREARSKAAKRRDQTLAEAAQKKLSAAKAELAAAKKLATGSSGISNTLANGFLKTLETSTAAGIASAIKSMNTKLQAAGLGGLVPGNLATSSRLQSLANQRAAAQSRISTAQQYASDQSTSLGDFLSLSNTPSASISSLISRMAARQKQASGFASEVSGLSKRGLDKNLLSQLADAGPGSQLAALLAKATAADIGQLNKLAVSQQKLTVSFGRSMADAMYDSGSQAGRGFLSGLQAQEKAIQAEMNRLAAGMVNTIKKKLGIRSPSTVMRDQIGRQVVLGAAAGVRQYAPHATREVQRMADTMAAVRARSGAVPVAVGGGGQVVHNESHTHYEINARTADFTPQQLEVLQRKAEARQRVGRPR